MVFSILCNAAIAVTTAVLLVLEYRKNGVWDKESIRKGFRFFTVQSNVLSALAALAVCVSYLSGAVPYAVWLLKYLGTAAVSVTLVTVLLFLGPAMGGYKDLLSGTSFYYHMVGPLMAIVSFSFAEKRGMPLGTALLGMLPMVLYSILYMKKVVFTSAGKGWPDLYGFNKGGNWKRSMAMMYLGTLLICLGLMALQNL